MWCMAVAFRYFCIWVKLKQRSIDYAPSRSGGITSPFCLLMGAHRDTVSDVEVSAKLIAQYFSRAVSSDDRHAINQSGLEHNHYNRALVATDATLVHVL